jgi:hypothetical protein
MKAIIYTEYGSPDAKACRSKTCPKDNEVLIKTMRFRKLWGYSSRNFKGTSQRFNMLFSSGFSQFIWVEQT